MLKEKEDEHYKYNKRSNCGIGLYDQAETIQALIDGSMAEGESLNYLRRLSSTEGLDQLNQPAFKLVVDTVRSNQLPESRQFFCRADKLIDCCGTGGSGLSHYNTSTTVAFVLAAAGLKVAKFGNRAASSSSGSFDLLDKLGIGASLSLNALADVLDKTNLTFLFAPQFYPALATLAPLRRAVGTPTVFNYIGPLLNPADPVYRLIGAPNKQVQELIAGHLQADDTLELEQALIVNAHSGMDELDVHSKTTIVRVSGNANDERYRRTLTVSSEQSTKIQSLKLNGKKEGPLTVDDNAQIFQALISGQLGEDNYYHTLVCLNAAAGLQAAKMGDSLDDGLEIAIQVLNSGSVKAKFVEYQDQFRQHM